MISAATAGQESQQAQQTMQQLESASTMSETLKLLGELEALRMAQGKYEDEKQSDGELTLELRDLLAAPRSGGGVEGCETKNP